MKVTFLSFLLLIIFISVKSNNGQENCYEECFDMKDNKCNICYKVCKTGDDEKFEYKSCKSDICLHERQNYPRRCISSLKSENLTEEKCLERCCHSKEPKLNNETIKECHVANDFINKPLNQNPSDLYLACIFLAKFILIIAFVVAFAISCTILVIISLILQVSFLFQPKLIKVLSNPCDKELIKKLGWKDQQWASNDNIFACKSTSCDLRTCQKCKKLGPNCQQSESLFHLNCLIQKYLKDTHLSKYKKANIFCQQCKLRLCSITLDIGEETFQRLHNYGKINCDKCVQKINEPNQSSSETQIQIKESKSLCQKEQ